MKTLNIMTLFILLLGIFYISFSIWGISLVIPYKEGNILNSYIPILLGVFILGSLSMTSAIGIFLRNNFFRKFWLNLVFLIAVFHGSWFIYDLFTEVTVMDVIEPIIAVIYALVSWKIFRSKRVIELYERTE